MQSSFQCLGKVAALSAMLALQACGGGGGSETTTGGGATTPTTPTTPTAPAGPVITPTLANPGNPVTTASVAITGVATYDSVAYTSASNAGLNYAGAVRKPIRAVTVQAVSPSNVVLASTTSSDTGSYTLNVPSGAQFSILVRAELLKTSGASQWNVTLRDNVVDTDNPNGSAPWVVQSSAVCTAAAAAVCSFNATTGWSTSANAYTGFRAAGLFALLDTVYEGMKLINTAQPSALFPTLNIFWSERNIASSGNLVEGDIGTSFFAGGTAASGAVSRSLYILGAANNDTDEFDGSIIAHEYGHYLQSAFSVNPSTGGSHSGNDKLDMTLAFGEAWGNAYSSMARKDPIYADSLGPRQAGGFTNNLGTAPTDASRGWYRENSLGNVLYAFFTNSSGGFTPIWTALTGPMKTSQDALATVFSFAAAVRSGGNAAASSALNTLLAAQNIGTAGADQWGSTESNNGGNASNLPVYAQLALGTATPVCFINTNVTDDTANKLGSIRYYRFTLASAGTRTVTANFAAGRDIDFDVFQRGELVARAAADNLPAGTSESKSVNLAAGEVVIRVKDYVTTSPPVGANCATLRVN